MFILLVFLGAIIRFYNTQYCCQVCLLSLSSATGPAGNCVCAFRRLFSLCLIIIAGRTAVQVTTGRRGDWRGDAGAAVPARCLSAYGTEMPLPGLRSGASLPCSGQHDGLQCVVLLSGCTVSDR